MNTNNDAVLINKLMQEIGLDVDNDNNVIDQDNGNKLQFNGKNLKLVPPNTRIIPKQDIEFNPIDNVKLMNTLFSYYTTKINEEDGRYINIYYPVEIPNSKKGMIEAKDGDNHIIRSNPYYNDSLKYADLIFQLGGENVNLDAYDREYTARK